MSVDQVFVDTNILLYAHDADARLKHVKAKERIAELWSRPLPPAISIQVLQEFYVNLIRRKVPVKAARDTITDYLEWDVIDNNQLLFRDGLEMTERFGISLWNALIIAAARKAGAAIIWSEDFNAGQDYGGVVVINPLL